MRLGNVTIIGVGLIGGSVGLTLRKNHICKKVIGVVRREESIKETVDLGIVDEATVDLVEGCSSADIIIIATPITTVLEIAHKLKTIISNEQVVMDVASVKGKLVYELEKIFGNGKRYIGTHPMAGSEKRGPVFADEDLFKGATTILTPTSNTDRSTLKFAEEFWKILGSTTIILDPYLHDKLVSVVSHLPHIVAWSLLSMLDFYPDSKECIGSGFKDMTRIGGSNPTIWRQICEWNRENLLTSIDEFKKVVERFYTLIAHSEWDKFERVITELKEVREGLDNERGKNS